MEAREEPIVAEIRLEHECAVRPAAARVRRAIGFQERSDRRAVAIVLVAAGVPRPSVSPAEVESVVDSAPVQRERVAGREIHGCRIGLVVEPNARPAARTACVTTAGDAAEDARGSIPADKHCGRGPVDRLAHVVEPVTGLVIDLPHGIEDDSVGDEARRGLDVFLTGNRTSPGRLRVGLPRIKLQERVEIVPAAAVENLDRRVPGRAPSAISPFVSRRFPQGGHHRMLPAAERPAVYVDEFQRRNAARLVWVSVVIVDVAAEVVQRDDLLVVGPAAAGHRVDDRLQR